MSRKLVAYCEQCGGTDLSGTDEFLVFHALAFCCAECRDDYRAADEARRDARFAASQLATVAEVMRRDSAAAARPAHKRRAA